MMKMKFLSRALAFFLGFISLVITAPMNSDLTYSSLADPSVTPSILSRDAAMALSYPITFCFDPNFGNCHTFQWNINTCYDLYNFGDGVGSLSIGDPDASCDVFTEKDCKGSKMSTTFGGGIADLGAFNNIIVAYRCEFLNKKNRRSLEVSETTDIVPTENIVFTSPVSKAVLVTKDHNPATSSHIISPASKDITNLDPTMAVRETTSKRYGRAR